MNDTDIPFFPVPNFRDTKNVVQAIDYTMYSLKLDDMGSAFYLAKHPMAKIAKDYIYNVGWLSQNDFLSHYGLKFKVGIDAQKAMFAIKVFSAYFGVKHEMRVGTVGVAIANWCEPL